MSGINYIDYYIPEEQISVEDVIKNTKNFIVPEGYSSIDEYCMDFKRLKGLDKIAVGNKEQVIPKLKDMVSRFFSETNVNPDDISYIVSVDLYENVSSELSFAGYIQKEFKMSNASVFSIHQGCASSLLTMGMCNKLLDEKNKYLMVLTTCVNPERIDGRYIQSTVVGDALGLLVMHNKPESFNVVDFISLSDGITSHDKYHGIEKEYDVIAAVAKGVSIIKKLLNWNKVSISDIYMMVPQNINYQTYINLYAKMLNIQLDKVFHENIPCGGHLGDVDVIRNLKDLARKYNIPNGSNILLYGLGGPRGRDKSYCAVLLKYTGMQT